MREFAIVFSIVILGALIFGGSTAAQVLPPVPVPILPGQSVVWDHTKLDIQGNPESLASFDVALTSTAAASPDAAGAVLRQVSVPEGGPSPWSIVDTELFAGQGPGVYAVWVRAVDSTGNKSTWHGPLGVAWDRVVPAAPSGIRVQ